MALVETVALNLWTMLKSLSRLLVVLALALVVPVQGIAAVSAGVCMALGHHGGESSSVHQHSGNGYDTSPGDHHHDEGNGTDKSSAHCPPCAACCATAAIASFPGTVAADRPATSVITEPVAMFPRVLPHRLDRPPLAL